MNKGIRLIKRLVALILVLLLSIENYAAVVSDNDGSAFITKAEFDSLKNNFQSQIDQYNTSIDSKIDGAIASYLAGLTITKSSVLNDYVANYTDMKWCSDWKVYGRYRSWSDWQISQEETDKWFQPWFDSRLTMRTSNYNNGGLNIYNFRSRADWVGFTYMFAEFTGFHNGVAPAKEWPTTGGNQQTVPVSGLIMNYDEDSKTYYVSTQMKNYYGAGNYISAIPRSQTPSKEDGDDVWHFYGPITLNPSATDKIKFNNPGNKQYLNYDISLYDNATGQSATTKKAYTFNEIIDQSSSTYPNFYYTMNVTSDWNNYRDTVNAIHYINKTSYTDPFFSDEYGCHFQYINETNGQSLEILNSLMLGDDNTQKINVVKPLQSMKTLGEGYDMTGTFTKSGYVTFNVKQAKAKGITNINHAKISNDTLDDEDVNVSGTFNVPFWPQEYLNTLDNHKFKFKTNNNERYLKFGDGLPLSINPNNDGNCKVSFDFNCYKKVDDTAVSKSIKVDIKNGSFLDSTSNYVFGYVGVDDTGTFSEVKNLEFNGSKVQLVIPFKMDQGLWLRLCPTDKSGEYYAKISNLRVENIND